MKTKRPSATKAARRDGFVDQQGHGPIMTELYRKAEAQVRKQKKNSQMGGAQIEVESQRLLHELQVHQVELEMQNNELQEARDRMEVLLEKYTDFYDFAPVGYLSLDESGQILEVNLNGAALLGVTRAHLIGRRLPPFITPASRPTFLAFLKRVFADGGKQVCEATLLRENGKSIWADFHGTIAVTSRDPKKWCRVVVTDITVLKRAEEAQRRSDAILAANEELRREIARRKASEESLRKSEQHQRQLLAESHHMQEQLRQLSRQVLEAQEEERKRISRELHDVIAQTLTGINIRLATLKRGVGVNAHDFSRNIARTQKLVEKSVNLVHEFARELRPAVLDDLGLIPALHAFMKKFMAKTGVRAHLKAFTEVEKLNPVRRTVLFRVAQEALTNVARHAQASRVEVTIQKLADSGVCMRIKDDGKSFNVERVWSANGGKRLGLIGMKERLEMIGGKFAVVSAPGQGTTIEAHLPPAKGKRI